MLRAWLTVFFLAFAAAATAQLPSPERLFARPYVWGSTPRALEWAKAAPVLGFLWNAGGEATQDLYVWHAGSRKLVRILDVLSSRDRWTELPAEKDARLKQHLAPEPGLSEFSLSSDGRKAAFSWRGELFLAATDGSQPPVRLTRTQVAETMPKLTPDGSRLGFVRDGQLFVQDLLAGGLTQLTAIESGDGALTNYAWSPDGRSAVYLVSPAARLQVLPNYSGALVSVRPFARSVAGDAPAAVRCYVTPSDDSKPLLLNAGPWGPAVFGASLPHWSPDSRMLLHEAVHTSFKKQQLLVSDAATGRTRVLVEESDRAWVTDPFSGWSPDSKFVLYSTEADGFSHLYSIPAAGGESQRLTKGNFEIRAENFTQPPHWAGAHIYFTSTEGGASERHFYRMSPDGSGKQQLSSGPGLHAGRVSYDERHTAMLDATLAAPMDLSVDGVRVTRSPLPEFASIAWPKAEFVSFPSRVDRQTVQAKVLLPPGYTLASKGKQWPAVLFIHGSGYATSVLKQWGSYQENRFAFNMYLASKGFVVLDMDYRGSSGYGRDWRTGVYLNMGGPDLEDVLGGVDFLRGLGNIDTARVGMWGVSYGGFMTNMALFRAPGVFRAGVSWAPVNDWANYSSFYTGQRLGTPDQYPEAYRRSSPITFSSALKDALLMIHGMGDTNVLFQDSVQLAEKLTKEGKEFSEVFYAQENHGFVRDEVWVDAFKRTAAWLESHLR